MINEPSIPQERSRGFTLPEILVAVAMVGVLSAVVLPTVLGQMNKTEVMRIVQDLQAVEQGAQMFRTDVGAWPGDLEDLVSEIDGTDTRISDGTTAGDAFTLSEVALWRGPYLSRTSIQALGLETGGGARIVDGVEYSPSGTDPLTPSPSGFVYFTATDVTDATLLQVNLEMDGTEDDGTEHTTGRVRWASPTDGSLYFFPVPRK